MTDAKIPDITTQLTTRALLDLLVLEHDPSGTSETVKMTAKDFLREVATELTISSDAVTLTQLNHKLQPQSGTSDNLSTINGTTAGQSGVLYASDYGTDTITIKHNVGNILCMGAADITLSHGCVFWYSDGTKVFISGGGSSSSGGGDVSGDVIRTKYIITPSVATNDLTVALKYIDGNDPTPTNKLTFRVGNTEYDLTAAMSFTKNDGTNWCNAGSPELGGKNVQFFMYAIGETGASAGLKFGFSRIPYATTMADFVNTTTSEKYIAGNWTNFNSTDAVTNIGRFQAQLSLVATSYLWSIPAAKVVNFPIFETDPMTYSPQFTNLSVGNGTLSSEYMIRSREINFWVVLTFGSTTSISGAVTFTLPFSRRTYGVSTRHSNGLVRLSDTGVAAYAGITAMDTSSCSVLAQNAAGTYLTQAVLSSTVPFTWATGDEILIDNVRYAI